MQALAGTGDAALRQQCIQGHEQIHVEPVQVHAEAPRGSTPGLPSTSRMTDSATFCIPPRSAELCLDRTVATIVRFDGIVSTVDAAVP